MDSRKSPRDLTDPLLRTPRSSRPARYSSLPANFEPVLELAAAERRRQVSQTYSAETQAVPRSMLEPTRRSSRLQRLSLFLPSLITSSDSKKASDSKLKKPLPQVPFSADFADFDTPQLPSKLAPTTPRTAPASTGRPVTPPPSSKKLHKPEPLIRNTISTPTSPAYQPPVEGKKLRVISSLIPPTQALVHGHNRSVSSPASARPGTSDGEPNRIKKRLTWLGGGRGSRNTSTEDLSGHRSDAWVNAAGGKIDYNLAMLCSGDKVPELWEESADTFVYLFPKSVGRGPSFKVPSMVLSSSSVLMNYIQHKRRSEGRSSLNAEEVAHNLALQSIGTPPYTPRTSTSDALSSRSVSDGQAESIDSFTEMPHEIHLQFPTGLTTDGTDLTSQDVQVLVDIRNLFAFLIGQPLVATQNRPTPFRIFQNLGEMLTRFEFTNMDGSTYGESATSSFDYFLDDMRFADVRNSREKTIEGIILGEAMRCASLYTESFTHAIGKYSAVADKKFPLFDEISPATRAMMERASFELSNRQATADRILIDFEFPALFAGFAASTTTAESKIVRFKAWKQNFLAMKKFVVGYYKDLHGQWPPRGSSKKNSFVVGGLNRLVLKGLYADLCSLYDMKADRSELTTRTFDGDEEAQSADPSNGALRVLLGEFDRSSPPVKPPIPFDVPILPSISTIEPRVDQLSPKERNKLKNKNLKAYETGILLEKARNEDSLTVKSPFKEAYLRFEEKEAKRKSSLELVDQTYGHWIFLYAVLQSLPLLVIDVKDIRHTEAVEYFLCMPPPGNMPWIEDAPKTAWYGVAGGQQMVSLPSHLVENGVEAVYRRSHCWSAAERWIGHANGEAHELFLEPQLSPLAPPPGFGEDFGGPRPPSRGREDNTGSLDHNRLTAGDPHSRSRSNHSKRQSIALGLELLPIPMGGPGHHNNGSRGPSPGPNGSRRNSSMGMGMGMGGSRPSTPQSSGNTGATFDQILGSMDTPEPTKKGKGKKK